MKKVRNILLSLVVLICTLIFTTPIYAQDKTSPKAYEEYYNLLNSLVNGNPKDENSLGIDIYVPSDEDLLCLEDRSYATGLLSAQLVDFDNNGSKELFYVYLEENSKYTYKAYGYDNKNNELIKLVSGSIELPTHWSSRNSVSLVKYNNKTYIKVYDGFYHGGDYRGEEKYEFITFDDNKMKSETMIMKYEPTQSQIEQIFNGDLDETETYKYTYLYDNKEELIEYSKANEILEQYSEDEVIYLKYDHGYYSDLDMEFNYNTNLEFISKLRDKSFETSFTDAKNILNEEDYKNIDYFKDIFIGLNKYDKLNYDKSILIDFIFNLYLSERNDNYPDSSLNYISGQKDGNPDFTCSLPISKIQSVIYDLFGLDINFVDNDTFKNTFDGSEVVFNVKGDNIIRTGSYYIGDVTYERDLLNVYQIEDNYYFLDITETSYLYDGIDYIKHSAIIEKLDNGKFNLLKIEDRTLDDTEITTFIKTIKSKNDDVDKDKKEETVAKETKSNKVSVPKVVGGIAIAGVCLFGAILLKKYFTR